MASIAKLAIQIITDTAKMAAGLRESQDKLRRFRSDVQASAGGTDDLTASLLKSGAALGIAKKSLELAATAARQWFAEGVRMQSQLAELTGETETFASEWQRLKDRIGIGAVGVTNAGQAFLAAGQMAADAIQKFAGFEPTGKIQAELAAAAAESKRLDEAMKEVNQRLKEQERLKDRAKSLLDSLRTPSEKFADVFKELNDFAKQNIISQEQLKTGIDRASDAFAKQLRAQIEAKNKPVAFAEKGSQTAFQAIAAAKRNQDTDQKVSQGLLAAILAANEKNNALVRKDTAKPPIKIASGGF